MSLQRGARARARREPAAISEVIEGAREAFHPSGFLWPLVDENAPSHRFAEALGGEIIRTRQRQKPGDVSRNLLCLFLDADGFHDMYLAARALTFRKGFSGVAPCECLQRQAPGRYAGLRQIA